jgi:FkbM family methyltransferase
MFLIEVFRSKIPRAIFDRGLKIIHFSMLIKQSEVNLLKIIKSIIENRYIKDGQFILSNYGVWMFNNPSDKTFELACMGYRNNLEVILSKLRTPIIFLDIGANQGIFSIVAARNNFIKEIHAFEPNANLCKILNKNFLRNHIDKFKIHNYAISLYDGPTHLSINSTHSGVGKIIQYESNSIKINSKNRIYLNEQFMKLDLPIFLKVDVEGMQHEVLEEIFSSVLKKKLLYIFVELSLDSNENLRTINLLNENGFTETFRKKKLIYDALFEKF